MIRSFAALAVLLAIVSSSDAAVLVRFINTVPQRAAPLLPTYTTVGRVATEDSNNDRIGLQYFSRSLNGADVQSPTLVWTENVNGLLNTASTANSAPYGYAHSMPPLRAYHSTAAPADGQVDRVSTYLNAQLPGTTVINSFDADVSASDNYEQTTLKQDGVGLYLTFAAGTYQMQAYGILGDASQQNAIAQQPKQMTNTLRSVTFEDGRVYTIVAIGDGRWTATTVNSGNTVQLVLFEESTAPTTFGKAAVRWFHAVKSYAANPITVFRGDTSAAQQIAGNIAFGSLSDYVDVTPSTAQVFPLTVQTNAQTVIAPTSTSRVEVTHDLRAGLRATIICASNNEQSSSVVFCRMIPSRVVAYVRMINDLGASQDLVQGRFGSQQLKDVKVTLWGSYEGPRPDKTVEMSQVMGIASVPRSPATTRGLYGVVSNVASNSCTGYGEVWVPLAIMDNANRYIVFRDNSETSPFLANAGAANSYIAAPGNQASPVTGTNTQTFWGTVLHKRVHFIVKTEGGSTLTGESGAPGGGSPVREETITWYTTALLLDEYMEPGQYYSLIVTSPDFTTGTYAPRVFQRGNSERFFWRLDRTIDQVSAEASIPADKAQIRFIAFAEQTFGTTVNLRRRNSATNQVLTPAVGVTTNTVAANIAPSFTWNAPAVPQIADAGDYTIDDPATVLSTNCGGKYPTTDITLAAGDNIDVYLFNSFGCKITGNNNNLALNLCKAQSALVTGHAVNTLLDGSVAPTPAGPGFFAASASTASSSLVLLVAALLAVIAAQF